jgi:phosphatidylglycerophosphatase A
MKTEAPASQSAATAPAPLWAFLVATFFGIGNIKPGPGTWGSLAAALIWFALSLLISPRVQPEVLAGLIVIVIALGIPASAAVARNSGMKDPQNVVIDEVAGQWITLLFVPVAWQTVLAGFILFRGFDIL